LTRFRIESRLSASILGNSPIVPLLKFRANAVKSVAVCQSHTREDRQSYSLLILTDRAISPNFIVRYSNVIKHMHSGRFITTKKGGLYSHPIGCCCLLVSLVSFFRHPVRFHAFCYGINGHLSAVLNVKFFHDVTKVKFYRVL